MRTAGSVLTLLTGAASASWWHPSPPPAQAATPCPGGAEFKYEQVWSSGFRAVVTMSRWIPGRRVVVHFDEGELPGLRSYGAELLDTTATTATFSLGSTPGKSAADSFDLQGRGKPPKASAVRISCELPYPPPPPTPSKPPAPVDGCAEYAHALEVTEEWEGGYTMQVTLSSSLPHSIAPNLEVALNFSVATLGKEPAKAAGTGVVSMKRSNRRASLAPSPPSPMSAAATAVSTGKVVMRLQELRGAQLVAESRKRGVISVLVTPSETLNGGSSDGSADATDARRSSTTYRFDMDVLASHERPPRITCSERWPSPQPYIPPLPPISPPAPSPEPPLVPAPPFPPSPSPPPYPIFQCGAPESRYSFDAMEAGSSTSNVLEAAPLLQLSSQQNMPENGVYTASVHRLPGTNWPAAEHGLLTIRFAVEESTGEIMDVRGGTLSVPRNEEQIGNPTKELVFELRDSLRREELHFSKSQTLVLQFVGTGRLPTVNSITCDNSPATSRDVAYVESPTAVLLHMCTATSAHLCCGAQRIAQLRSSGAAGSQPMTAAPWCVDALALGRSCRDYAESAASCEAHYERAGVPCVFSREGCNAEQSGICEEPSPPTPPPAAPPPLPGCPASLGVQYRVSSSKPGMFTVSVKVENTQRKIVLSLSFGVNLTVSNVWGAQVYQEDLVIKDPSEVSTATVPRTTSISYTFESGFVSFVSETGKSGLLKFFGFTVSNFPEHFDPEDRRPTLSCEGKFPPNPPLPPHPPTPPRPPPSPHPPPPPCPFPPPPPPPEPWPPPGMPPPPPSPSPPPSPEPPWPPPPPSPPAPKLPPPPQCPPSRPTPARPPPLQPPPPPPMPPMSPPLKAAAPFDIEIVEVSCDILALSWKELQHEVNLQADSVAVEWSIVGSESTTSGGREAGLTTREEFPFYSPPPPSSPPPEPSRPPPPLPPILPSPPFVPPPMLPLPSVPPFAPPFAPPLCPPPPPRSPFRVASEPSAWEGTYEGIATSSDAHVKVTLRAGKGDIIYANSMPLLPGYPSIGASACKSYAALSEWVSYQRELIARPHSRIAAFWWRVGELSVGSRNIIWDGEDEWERLEEAVRTEDSTRIPSMNSADRNKMVGAREKAVTVSAHSHTSSAMSKIKVSTSRDSSRTVTQGRPVVRHLSPFFSQDSQPSQDFETPALFVRATNPKYNHSVYSLSNHSMQTELRTVATEIAEGQPGDSDSVLGHSLRLANLPPGVQIKYRLQARNVAGWGAWSAWMQAETPPASRRPGALEAPSVLRFSESCDAVTFQLPRRRNGCDGDGHMALELQPSGASSWLSVRQKLQPASTTEFDGLDPIGVYHFRLRAYNSAGPGPDGSQLLMRPCVFTSPPPLSVPPVLSPSQPPSPSPRNPPWFPPSPSPSISPPRLPCLQLPPQQPAPLTPCYSPSLLLPQPMPSLPRPLPPPPPQQHHPALIQALSPDLPPSPPTTPHPSTMGKSSAFSTSSIVSPKREETHSIHMPSAPAPPLPHQRNEPASVVSPTLQKPFSFYMPSAPTPPSPQHRNSPTILALQPPPVSSLLYSSRTHMDHASRQPDHEKTKTKEVPAHYHEQASKAIEARESRTNEVLTTEIKRDVKQEADASRTNEVLPTETLRDVKRDTIQEYLSDRAELPPWLVALLAGYFVNANQAILVAVVSMLFVVLIICMFACRKCGRAKSLHGYRAVGSSVAPKVCDYDSDEGTTTYECNRISHKETVKPNGKASSTTKQQYGLTSDHKNAYARNASSNTFEDGPACEWDDTAKHRRDDEPPCNWNDTHDDDEQHDGVSFSHHQLRHEHHMVVSL